MAAIIARKDVIDSLSEEVHRYAELYVSSRPGAVILFYEAFGDRYGEVLKKILDPLMKVLKRLTIYENPLYGYYLPYLYILGKKLGNDTLSKIAYETAVELINKFKTGAYEKWNEWLGRKLSRREEVKKFLVSAALSAKLLVELANQKVWDELSLLCSREFFENIMQEVKLQDLDPVTLVSSS